MSDPSWQSAISARWVHVSHRPPENGLYLVEGVRDNGAAFIGCIHYIDGEWVGDHADGKWVGGEFADCIQYWMSLPPLGHGVFFDTWQPQDDWMKKFWGRN